MNRLKLLSIFSGIGAFEKSLANIGVDYDLVGFSEIDKYAIKSFCAIHNVDESLNFGDVSRIHKSNLPDFDLLVGGSPCQSFSVAGARKGFEDTRGTLFFQYVETLKEKQPKYFVYENVKGLINHDKGSTLDTIAKSFDQVGYRIDMELLNSKYFNVPQNRERIYIIGIREDLIDNEEWTIDKKKKDILTKGKLRLKELEIKSFNFKYAKQELVSKRLRDILEDNVDEKYYISEEKAAQLIEQLEKDYTEPFIMDGKNSFGNKHKIFDQGIAPTCLSNDYKEPKKVVEPFEPKIAELATANDMSYCIDVNYAKGISPGGIGKGRRTHVLEEVPHWIPKPDGINSTLRTGGKASLTEKHNYDHVAVKVIDDTQSFDGIRVYDDIAPTLRSSRSGLKVTEEVIPCLTPDRVEKRQEGRRFKENNDPAHTVNTVDRHGVAIGSYPKYRIRKLTPLECFRLQAFSDEDFYKCQAAGISNSQLYKQAGNSITVTVLEEILKELLSEYIK